MLLIVEDDGSDWTLWRPAAVGQGFGLLGMHERAGLVGATLEIESSPGKGTTVIVRIAGDATHRRLRLMSSRLTPLRILLADDHVTVRHGLKLLIDSQPT